MHGRCALDTIPKFAIEPRLIHVNSLKAPPGTVALRSLRSPCCDLGHACPWQVATPGCIRRLRMHIQINLTGTLAKRIKNLPTVTPRAPWRSVAKAPITEREHTVAVNIAELVRVAEAAKIYFIFPQLPVYKVVRHERQADDQQGQAEAGHDPGTAIQEVQHRVSLLTCAAARGRTAGPLAG